jgi:hypothetical protein
MKRDHLGGDAKPKNEDMWREFRPPTRGIAHAPGTSPLEEEYDLERQCKLSPLT